MQAGDRQVLDELAVCADVAALVRDRDGRHVIGDVEALVPVFSVTKMFLAVATLRLAESGHLGLDAQVRRWLPQIAGAITVREILGHTAGLPDYPATADYLAAVADRPGEPWGPTEIPDASLTGDWPPRGALSYANVGSLPGGGGGPARGAVGVDGDPGREPDRRLAAARSVQLRERRLLAPWRSD